MKTTGFRSVVLYLLLAAFLGGLGYFLFNYCVNGSKWAMQPYNGHLYAENTNFTLGEIKDRDGSVLASTRDGSRVYSEDETVRRALLHTVGDTDNYISTSAQYTLRAKLSGYNIITGLNDTLLNSFNKNVTLTVKENACVAAYNALDGKNGAVLVYNYKTGEILAKVSTPTFDPSNVPEDLETNEAYKGAYLDNTLSSTFTPGSIFKVVTAAAAMDKWPDSWQERVYSCQGSYELGDDTITCLHNNAHGDQDMSAAMGNSCNIYFAQLATDLGAPALQAKAEEMGFGRQLHFGTIPVAVSSFDVSSVSANQLGWAAVGQHTALSSPYHMLVLMGAIANGGEYVQPKLTGDGDLFSSLTKGDSQVLLSATTAAQLKTLMRNDVENYYGDWLFPEGMNVCAKTGTGEVGAEKGPNCWIVGFCDSAASPYAFSIVVEDGVGGIESAGTVATAVLSALA